MENRDALAQQSPLSLNTQPFFQEIQGHRKKYINFYSKADELYANSRDYIRIDTR